MTNTLIVYGTRYSATASTSQEIGEVIRQEGLDVNIVNLKDDNVKDITDYWLRVGSGTQIKQVDQETQKVP